MFHCFSLHGAETMVKNTKCYCFALYCFYFTHRFHMFSWLAMSRVLLLVNHAMCTYIYNIYFKHLYNVLKIVLSCCIQGEAILQTLV